MSSFVPISARRGAVLLALILLALQGCSYSGPPSTFEELGADANTKDFGDLYPPDNREPGEFTFGIGDSALIDVSNAVEFSGTFVVRPDGKVYNSILGDTTVAGLTTDELKRKWDNKVSLYLKPGYVVTAGTGAIVSRRFYVAAPNPLVGGYIVREVQHDGDETLFDVWIKMGSPSTLLDDDTHVKVIRGDPRHPVVHTINVREILVAGRTGGNIQIKPNDIVYVPTTVWGKFNEVMSGLSLPFTGILRISSSIVQTDRAFRVLSGDQTNNNFYGP